MSRQSELLRRLRQLPPSRREEFLTQIEDVTRGAKSSPLTFRQEQLWLFDRVAPSGTAYGLGFALDLSGPLDTAALERAVGDVVERHVILRTAFPHESETGTQVVRTAQAIRLTSEEHDAEWTPRSAEDVIRADLRSGLDADSGPLVRFRLVRRSEREHVLLVISHYLVMDPRSIDVLCADLATSYAARREGRAPEFAAPAERFGDFAAWQRDWTEGEEAEPARAFWRRELAGWENTELQPDLPRPRLLQLNSGTARRPLPPETVQRVPDLAAALGVTAEDVLLAAYFALVSKHTAATDLIIGLPREVFGPFSSDTLVGDCGNLLPLRVEIETAASFEDLVRSVRDRRTEVQQHAALPFKAILDLLDTDPDPARLPLAQLGFTPPPRTVRPLDAGDLRISATQVDTGVGTFELALETVLNADEPSATVRYSTALYRQETAERLVDRYLRLLGGVCAAPDLALSELPFADEGDLALVREVWNSPLGAHPQETVHEGFERVARERGGEVAISWRGGELTYAELDAWGNRVAQSLSREGVGPGAFVPVLVTRGPQTIAAMLGVLKAGAAYVPIDLSQPEGRVSAIVDDCGARLALVSEETAHVVQDRLTAVDVEAGTREMPETPLGAPAFPESLAYVIYTSGSTGRPKGVLVEHRNVTNFIQTVQEMFRLGPEDRILQFASPGFDVSVFEIFGALLSGARLRVMDEEERGSVDALDAVLSNEGITVIDLPPAVMELLDPDGYPDLRVAFVGGEAFSGELTTRWARRCDFYNGYGPTETTVTVVAKRCEGRWTESPPIGRAMANHRAYTLDQDLGLLPHGAVGELAIAGLGVARGYLGQPALTAERFRPDPHGPPGSRMYVTGDLASWDEDGDLRFLGRTDRQVKVRGVRIELGEVEAALQAIEGVTRAVADVSVDPYRGSLLVAYVVANAEAGPAPQLDTIRAELGMRLPPTMVPSVLVPLTEVPLTQSGKIDRRSLPAVEFSEVEIADEEDDEHSTPTERRVRAEVFAPLLGTRLGNHSNFFAHGGTSLQAIRISSRVKSVFGAEVSIADFFVAPTVSGLAALVDQAVERDRRRRDGLAGALDLVEGRSDEEVAELARALDPNGTND